MKYFIIISLLLISFTLNAQTTAYWIGGTVGAESEWNLASNWSTQRVPNEDTKVIIKGTNSGHNAMPVIKQNVQIASIELHHGGTLIIQPTGEVLLNGEFTYTEGIVSYGGQLLNNGIIRLDNLDQFAVDNVFSISQGKGQVIRDNNTYAANKQKHW